MNVLVLNSSYEPLSVTLWQRAVELIYSGKAEAVHNTSRRLRSAGGFEIPLPSVIRILYYVRRRAKRVALTKKNVLLRDDYLCQYCGVRGDSATMTVDHVVAKSVGGPSSWDNLVAACTHCNNRKGNRTAAQAGMTLRRKPKEPRHIPFLVVRRHTENDEWWKYLALYSVSIEERPLSC